MLDAQWRSIPETFDRAERIPRFSFKYTNLHNDFQISAVDIVTTYTNELSIIRY